VGIRQPRIAGSLPRLPQKTTRPVKITKYDPIRRQESILTAWAHDPIVVSDDPKEACADAAHQMGLLSSLVIAHKAIETAMLFSDEGSDETLSEIKAKISGFIECYSETI
jgi:hypothetical protein